MNRKPRERVPAGARVKLTHPSYPHLPVEGTLVDEAPHSMGTFTNTYATYTVVRDDGTRFRNEGVLTFAGDA